MQFQRYKLLVETRPLAPKLKTETFLPWNCFWCRSASRGNTFTEPLRSLAFFAWSCLERNVRPRWEKSSSTTGHLKSSHQVVRSHWRPASCKVAN